MIILTTLIIAAGLFARDVRTPLEAGMCGFYLAPVLLAFRERRAWYPFVIAGVCSVFLVSGVCWKREVNWRWNLADRLAGTTGLWVAAALVARWRRAERALHENQERLDVAQSAGRIGIFEWEADTGRVIWSTALERLYGMEPGRFGGTFDDWSQLVHPDDRARAVAERKEAVANRVSYDCEFRVIRPDGTIRWLRSVARAFDGESGEPPRMVGVNMDITEAKLAQQALEQSEAAFRAISEQSLMGIFTLQDEKLTYVNPRFAEIFGYTPAEALGLESVYGLIAEEDRTRARELMEQRLAEGGAGLRFQGHGVRKDGKRVAIESQGIRMQLNGRPAIIGTLQDLSERELGEVALRRTTEQLQTLSHRLLELQEAERRHIARELHDEIGQALTALKINLQAVQRQTDAAQFAPRLLDSIGLVDRTLRQVRALSLDLRPSMLDDLGLSAALRWYADQQARRAGLRIRFDGGELDGQLEPALKTACFRVAQEALTNVVRHARATSVQVRLEAEGESLHLSVCDDGVGFDPRALRHGKEAGASLGMLGMQERASLIGGRIEWISGPRRGTEVHAWFPLAWVTPPQAGENGHTNDDEHTHTTG